MQTAHALTALVFALGLAAPATAHDDHGDITVGRTGITQPTATRLAIEADLDSPVFLAPASGLAAGWTSGHPGFNALAGDEPDERFWTLASGAQVRLEVVSISGGLAVVQPGGGAIADAAGESVLLGGATLHAHPTWYAQASTLGSGWTGTLTATFRLIDTGTTGYESSDPFTMTFTNVPEPTAAILLGLGALGLVRRR